MITSEQILPIGHIAKMHGTKGEMLVAAAPSVDPDTIAGLKRVAIDFDGIYVPFFVESVRPRGIDAVLLKLDEDAPTGSDFATLPGKTLYAFADDVDLTGSSDDEEGLYLSDLVGYTVVLADTRTLLGTVTDYDDSTANLLLIVTTPDNRKIMVPVADEFFNDINDETRTLVMNIPEGLIEMQ